MAFNSIRSTVHTAEDVEDGGDDPVADHPENLVVIGLQRNRNRNGYLRGQQIERASPLSTESTCRVCPSDCLRSSPSCRPESKVPNGTSFRKSYGLFGKLLAAETNVFSKLQWTPPCEKWTIDIGEVWVSFIQCLLADGSFPSG